jgi:hypothetical protein
MLGDLVGRLERHLHLVSREQIVVVRYKELVRHAEATMRSPACRLRERVLELGPGCSWCDLAPAAPSTAFVFRNAAYQLMVK